MTHKKGRFIYNYSIVIYDLSLFGVITHSERKQQLFTDGKSLEKGKLD